MELELSPGLAEASTLSASSAELTNSVGSAMAVDDDSVCTEQQNKCWLEMETTEILCLFIRGYLASLCTDINEIEVAKLCMEHVR